MYFLSVFKNFSWVLISFSFHFKILMNSFIYLSIYIRIVLTNTVFFTLPTQESSGVLIRRREVPHGGKQRTLTYTLIHTHIFTKSDFCMQTHTYFLWNTHTHTHMYKERENEKERYIDRERERKRERLVVPFRMVLVV